MSIQRYVPLGGDNMPDPNGEFVTYADYVAQVEAMRVASIETCIALVREWIYADDDHEGEELFAALREARP